MPKNNIVWPKVEVNLCISITRHGSVNEASSKGDPKGVDISTVKNVIFVIVSSTWWVLGGWQFQIYLIWTNTLWWREICQHLLLHCICLLLHLKIFLNQHSQRGVGGVYAWHGWIICYDLTLLLYRCYMWVYYDFYAKFWAQSTVGNYQNYLWNYACMAWN
jgi:hypothetical protein